MISVTVENLKEIHRCAIDSGLKDELSLRDSVLNEGTPYYICDCANSIESDLDPVSLLSHHLSTMHPFLEGNKRTAFLAAEDAIGIEKEIISDKDDINNFVRNVASGLVNQ